MKTYWLSSIPVFVLAVPVFAGAADSPAWMRSLREDLQAVANCPPQYRVDLQRDCGSTALTAALLLLGRVPHYSDIERELRVWDKGTSLSRVEECAKRNGLSTLAISMPPRQLARLRHLAILHVKSHPEAQSPDHFVLYAGQDDRGRLRLLESSDRMALATQERLERVWAGTALVLAPAPLSSGDLFRPSYLHSAAVICLLVGGMICLLVLCTTALRLARHKHSGGVPRRNQGLGNVMSLALMICLSMSSVVCSGCARKKAVSVGTGPVSAVPTVVDLGVVRAGTKARDTIIVKNSRPAPLTIQKIDYSCSCAVTKFPRVIDAWGQGQLEVELRAGENSGTQTNILAILTDSPEVPRLTVTLKALVRSEWTCAPRGVNFGEINWKEDRPLRTLTIDYVPVEAPDAVPSIEAHEKAGPFLDLTVASARAGDSAPGQHRYVVSVKPRQVIPIGRLETVIAVRGNVPGGSTREWEIPVWAEVRGPISVTPKSLVAYRGSVRAGDVIAEMGIQAIPPFLLKVERIECDDIDMLGFNVTAQRDDGGAGAAASTIQVLAKGPVVRAAGTIRIVCRPDLSIRVPYVICTH